MAYLSTSRKPLFNFRFDFSDGLPESLGVLEVWLSLALFMDAEWIYLFNFSIVRFVFYWAVELYNFLVEICTLLRSYFITYFDVFVDRGTSQVNSHPWYKVSITSLSLQSLTESWWDLWLTLTIICSNWVLSSSQGLTFIPIHNLNLADNRRCFFHLHIWKVLSPISYICTLFVLSVQHHKYPIIPFCMSTELYSYNLGRMFIKRELRKVLSRPHLCRLPLFICQCPLSQWWGYELQSFIWQQYNWGI